MALDREKIKAKQKRYLQKNKQIGIVFPLDVYNDAVSKAEMNNISLQNYLKELLYRDLYGISYKEK